MKAIHIRQIDDGVMAGLKRRAARHRRSLQKEIEVLLADAAAMLPGLDTESASPHLSLVKVSTGRREPDYWSRSATYGDDGR